jgi:hypothetical protein
MAQRAGEEYSGPYQAIVSGSQFVAAVELGDATPTLTIDSVRVATVESMDPGKGASDKLIVYFAEASKGWIVNSTNGKCLAAMWGDDVRGWIGKRVTLIVEPVRFGGKTLPGIRIKGSPDIGSAIQVEIKMPRKKATYRELVPTGGQRASQPSTDEWDGNGGMGDRE